MKLRVARWFGPPTRHEKATCWVRRWTAHDGDLAVAEVRSKFRPQVWYLVVGLDHEGSWRIISRQRQKLAAMRRAIRILRRRAAAAAVRRIA